MTSIWYPPTTYEPAAGSGQFLCNPPFAMNHVIYNVAPWRIEQDPTRNGSDRLVRFHKHNGQRKLLDQIAEWQNGGWSIDRWRPRSPQVPDRILRLVENHMRQVTA